MSSPITPSPKHTDIAQNIIDKVTGYAEAGSQARQKVQQKNKTIDRAFAEVITD